MKSRARELTGKAWFVEGKPPAGLAGTGSPPIPGSTETIQVIHASGIYSKNDKTLENWVKNAKVKAGPELHEYRADWDETGKTTVAHTNHRLLRKGSTMSFRKTGGARPCRQTFVWALVLFPAFGVGVLLADGQKKGEFRGELEKLRGTWLVKSIISNGQQINDSYKMTFFERTYTKEWPQRPLDVEPPKLESDFELDSTGQFKVIWEIWDMAAGKEKDDRRRLAQIYRFQGEKLEICYHVARERWRTPPDQFDAVAGSGRKLITLERVKPEPPKKKQP
jgi:uncharacterized protein (TIGR03067 family)